MRPFPISLVPVVFCGLLTAAAMVTAPARAHAQAPAEPPATAPLPQGTTLEQIMPPDVFRSAGLKKLSAKELAALNEWLQGYRAQAEKIAVEKVVPPPSPKRVSTQQSIESNIRGEFLGLKGRTRVLLANGQVWQQSNSTDRISARLNNPYCILVRDSFGYKMLIAGLGRPFRMRQIVLDANGRPNE